MLFVVVLGDAHKNSGEKSKFFSIVVGGSGPCGPCVIRHFLCKEHRRDAAEIFNSNFLNPISLLHYRHDIRRYHPVLHHFFCRVRGVLLGAAEPLNFSCRVIY